MKFENKMLKITDPSLVKFEEGSMKASFPQEKEKGREGERKKEGRKEKKEEWAVKKGGKEG